MKRFFYLLIAVMFLSAIPEVSYAQSNDPFEQEALKTTGKDKNKEKKVDRKKQDAKNEEADPAPKPETKPQFQLTPNEMTISYPCDEKISFEFISLVGGIGSQKLRLTGKIVNHDVNKSIDIGHNFISYDNEGVEHSGWQYSYSSSHKTLTDVPVKFEIEIPGQVNPAKTKTMPVVGFEIDGCRVEMRNVPIDWK